MPGMSDSSIIRIRKHLDSDTLHLPELRGMIGRDVEITVRDDASAATAPTQGSGEFWKPPSLEELRRRQGFRGPFDFKAAYGALADADWEGFDEFLEENRAISQNGNGDD